MPSDLFSKSKTLHVLLPFSVITDYIRNLLQSLINQCCYSAGVLSHNAFQLIGVCAFLKRTELMLPVQQIHSELQPFQSGHLCYKLRELFVKGEGVGMKNLALCCCSFCSALEERNFRSRTFAACVTKQTPMLALMPVSSCNISSEGLKAVSQTQSALSGSYSPLSPERTKNVELFYRADANREKK